MSEQDRPKRCQRCGERLGEHGSYVPGMFRCSDGTDVPWSRFNDGAGERLATERRFIEYGFIYDGNPEWSSHAYVKWTTEEAAERWRQDAILWRDPEKVGGLICRERVSYADHVGQWSSVTPPAESSDQ